MLDVSIRLEILSLLDDLRQRLRLALLYITHDIASARYFADEVLVMFAGQVVERGPAEEVTQRPRHPYTQLLIASAPDPDNLAGARGKAVKVTAPAAAGCPFSTRCPLVTDQCRTASPALEEVSPTRAAACWHLDQTSANP